MTETKNNFIYVEGIFRANDKKKTRLRVATRITGLGKVGGPLYVDGRGYVFTKINHPNKKALRETEITEGNLYINGIEYQVLHKQDENPNACLIEERVKELQEEFGDELFQAQPLIMPKKPQIEKDFKPEITRDPLPQVFQNREPFRPKLKKSKSMDLIGHSGGSSIGNRNVIYENNNNNNNIRK